MMTERGSRLPTATRIGFGRSAISLIVRQAQNPVELQLQLVLIEIPQALADAAEIAPSDFVEPRLDDADLAIVVEIELQRRQRQRHDRAEQQNGGEQAQTNAAMRPFEHLPETGAGRRSGNGRFNPIQTILRDRRHDGAFAARISLALVHAPPHPGLRHTLGSRLTPSLRK